MKNKKSVLILFGLLSYVIFPNIVYANSSWHWLDSSPLPVLPYAIALTLLVEIIIIKKYGGVKKTIKAAVIVCLANVFSYLAPTYIMMRLDAGGGLVYTFAEIFEKWPNYMVRLGSVLLTLIVEIPVVYFSLNENTDQPKTLLKSIFAANIITSVLIGIAERILFPGSW